MQQHPQGHGVLTLTLAARARELAYNYDTIEAYAHLANQQARLNFALVAGHQAYSSVDVRLSSQKTMTWLAKTLRQLTAPTTPLLVGMENLPRKFAVALVQGFQLIPFYLKSEKLEQELAEFQKLVPHCQEYAVYSPIHFTEDVTPFLQQMVEYILRRERSQHQLATMDHSAETVRKIVTMNTEVPASLQAFLRQRLNDLTMYGANIQQQCHGLQRSGISIIIGHPSIPHETESAISRLAQVLHS
ncbi:MAG: hypothetical protein ACE5OZ_11855 [Candidatus Heimdallarchaeota archaeon]